MLAKQYKLRKPSQFDEVYKQGKFIITENFRINYDYKGDLPHVQVAVPVSKKYGNAVERNRLRRLVFGLISNDNSLLGTAGLRLIISPKSNLRPEMVAVSAEQISQRLISDFVHLQQSKV